MSVLTVDNVVARLSRRKLVGSFQVATETALLCRQVVSTYRWVHVDQLIQHFKIIGKQLTLAQPREFTSGNIVRRVLKLIREIHADSIAGRLDENEHEARSQNLTTSSMNIHQQNLPIEPQTSIHSAMLNLLGRPESSTSTHSDTNQRAGSIASGNNLRPAIIAGIQDLIDELTKVYKDIGVHALQHIHSSEIILTHGPSKTVSSFLRQAAESRKFTVIITESCPNDAKGSYELAESLSLAGINAIIVPDSAVYGLMSRVNKVILGTHAVLQNGGLLAASGANQVALAAQAHAIPVVIVTGVYKLTPFFPYDYENLIELVSPEKVLPFREILQELGQIDVLNPYYDYVQPELIALYITNLGAHAPTTLHRTMAENYDTEDDHF